MDKIEKLRNSTIQHGPGSDRVYLMKLDPNDMPEILNDLEGLAGRFGYSKLFAKVHSEFGADFEEAGFLKEAEIPGFYGGRGDAVFMSRFFSDERRTEPQLDRLNENIALAEKKASSGPKMPSGDIEVLEAAPSEAEAVSSVFSSVFRSYPFPVFDPEYIVGTMKSHVRYFYVPSEEGTPAAVASSEIDYDLQNAEMTDFAVMPEARGNNLASAILDVMEMRMKEDGIRTLYTISRAVSPPVNILFARFGYIYGGTLIKNTDICGTLESMNVWYKNC